MGKRHSRKKLHRAKNHGSHPKGHHTPAFDVGGADVISCAPYVYTVGPQESSIRCHCCLEMLSDDVLKRAEFVCGSCTHFRYCGTECQNKDKVRHVMECPIWKRMKNSGIVPDVAFILLIRSVLQIKVTGKEDDWELVKFKDLQPHLEELLKDEERKAMVVSVRKSAAKILKMAEKNLLNPDSFPELYGRIRFNIIAVQNSDPLNPVKGYGIYLRIADVKHSCVPNSCAVFQGLTLRVRPLKKIQSISEVTIAFVDPLAPLSSRRKMLLEEYAFSCDCERCSRPRMDPEMYALRCRRKSCNAAIPSDLRCLSKCEKCGAVYDNDQYSSALILMADFPILKSSLAKKVGSVTNAENSYPVLCELNTALEQYESLHCSNPYFSALTLFMGRVLLKRKEYSQAALWMEFSLDAYRKWLDVSDPAIGMLLLKIAETHFAALMAEETLKRDEPLETSFAKEANRVLQISHGRDSALAMYAMKLLIATKNRSRFTKSDSSSDDSDSVDGECSCGRCSSSSGKEEKNYKDFFIERDFFAQAMRGM